LVSRRDYWISTQGVAFLLAARFCGMQHSFARDWLLSRSGAWDDSRFSRCGRGPAVLVSATQPSKDTALGGFQGDGPGYPPLPLFGAKYSKEIL
jgi:hypothetical protein